MNQKNSIAFNSFFRGDRLIHHRLQAEEKRGLVPGYRSQKSVLHPLTSLGAGARKGRSRCFGQITSSILRVNPLASLRV